jgi:hypothetical protein
MAEQLAMQMDLMMDVSSEKRTETSLAQLTAMPTETRLVYLLDGLMETQMGPMMETRSAQLMEMCLDKLTEMPKEMSLVHLSAGLMAMQRVLLKEMRLDQLSEMRLALLTVILKEMSLVHLLAGQTELSLACLSDGLMAMQTVEMMEIRLEKRTATKLEQRKEMLTELSLVHWTDWRKAKQMV